MIYHFFNSPEAIRFFNFEDYLLKSFVDCFTMNEDASIKEHWFDRLKVKGFTIFYNRDIYISHGLIFVTDHHISDCMEVRDGILCPKPRPHPIPHYPQGVNCFSIVDTFGEGSDFEKKILKEITIPGRKGSFISITPKEMMKIKAMVLEGINRELEKKSING